MTRKQRGYLYEFIALIVSGFFGAFVIPTLASEHDTVPLFAAAALLAGWLGWSAYLVYRLIQEKK